MIQKIFDNTALMLLKLLISIQIKEVNFAGFDGFSEKITDNYASDNLLNIRELEQLRCTNKLLRENLIEFKKSIKINFITKTLLN